MHIYVTYNTFSDESLLKVFLFQVHFYNRNPSLQAWRSRQRISVSKHLFNLPSQNFSEYMVKVHNSTLDSHSLYPHAMLLTMTNQTLLRINKEKISAPIFTNISVFAIFRNFWAQFNPKILGKFWMELCTFTIYSEICINAI